MKKKMAQIQKTIQKQKRFYYKKLRLTDDYQYESEEEEKKKKKKKKNRLVKGLIKKLPKNPTKDDWIKCNEWVNEKERCLNSKIFQKYFNYQRPSSMLKELYKINDKYKNNDLVNVIKNGLSDLKKKIENMCEKEKEIEQLNEIRYC